VVLELTLEAEYQVVREARGIALDLLVQAFGGHALESGEFGSEQHAMAA
jgi:hypothetical protein